MTTRFKHITVVMIAILGLLGLAAQADLISIDFNHMSSPDTALGTVTDVNGHDSLPGQEGAWNDLLVGNQLGRDMNGFNHSNRVPLGIVLKYSVGDRRPRCV